MTTITGLLILSFLSGIAACVGLVLIYSGITIRIDEESSILMGVVFIIIAIFLALWALKL